MSATETCPGCEVSLVGDPVPAEYRVHGEGHDEQVARSGRCFCFPYGDTTHFSRIIGHEDPYVYDGVLFWSCPDCGHAWPRWTSGRLGVAAARAAALFVGCAA